VFGTKAHSDHPGGNPEEEWKSCDQTDREGLRKPVPIYGDASDDSILNRELHSLRHAGRPLTPLLDPLEVLGCQSPRT
jgi:hypothetical protein